MTMRISLTMLRWACVCAALGMGTHAIAQHATKCTSVSGKVQYTDAPCAKSESASKVSIRPNALGTVDPRPNLLSHDAAPVEGQRRIAHQDAVLPPSVAQATVADEPSLARVDSLACQRAKRDYEVTASSSANTRAIIDAKRSMMYGACGQREPDVNQTIVIQRRPIAPLRGGAYAVFP